MIQNVPYRVNLTNLFFVFFKNKELQETFLSEYDAKIGFGIIETEKGYKVYTNSYVFIAQQKISNDTGACIGLRIVNYRIMTQSETYDAAVKRMQVVGLPNEYMCVERGYSPRILINGAPQLFRMVTEEQGKKGKTDNGEAEAKQIFLDEQEMIIAEKEKYDAMFLSIFVYKSFSDTLQNTQDGVIYKFTIDLTGDEELEESVKENTPVLVSVNDKGKPLLGVIVKSRKKHLYIKFRTDSDAFARLAPSGEIIEKSNPEYKLKKNAIRILKKGISNNPYLLDILIQGKTLPYERENQYVTHKVTESDGTIHDNVNPSQRDAIELAMDVEDFLLVQGPPGTGKTTIITEMVKLFAKQGKRILICSKNNLAVDNVLEKCQELYYDEEQRNKMQCLRLGREDRVLTSVRTVLPRPLTQMIQNDVKEKSEAARTTFIQQELEFSEAYEQAVKDTESFYHILKYLLKEKEVFERAKKKMEHSLFTLLLNSEQKKSFREDTETLVYILNLMLSDLWQMLWSEKIRILPENVEKISEGFQKLWSLEVEIQEVVQSAGKRFKLILGEHKDHILNGILSGKQKLNALNRISELVNYEGNAVAARMKMPLAASELDSVSLENVQHEMKDFVAGIREKCFLFKQILDEWHEELENDKNSFESSLLKSVKIIGATCIGVNTTEEFRDVEYDVAIVDEAGQITLHDLLVPFVKARKIIMIGDHLQLPPGSENDFCAYLKENDLLDFPSMETAEEEKEYENRLKELFSVSLFETFFRNPRFDKNKIMLDTQFRMHPDIAEFISQNFYDGKYKSGVTAEERSLSIGSFSKPMYFADTCNSSERYEDFNEDETIHTNRYEAKICASYLVEILMAIENDTYVMPKKKLKNEEGDYDIGVITAYKAQIDLIREETIQCLKNYYDEEKISEIMSRLAINTLDSFQGRANQIILYSFVRSNKEKKIGFLDEVRRLNVMMTRAKSLLVMVGDSKTLTESASKTVHDGKRASEYYRKLIEYCREKKGYIDVTEVAKIHE